MRLYELTEGLENPEDNPCWKGYHPVGTKKKNGKTVPNCVPKEGIGETKEAEYGSDYQAMVKRVGDLAKEGPRKTVWDPDKRVYKTVPVNPQKKDGVAEGKDWSPAAEETIKKDKIVSLKNLIAKYKEKGNIAKVRELQAELKSLQTVAEADKLQGTPVVSLSDFDDKDNKKNKYGQVVPKKLKKDDPRVKFHKDQKQGVAEALAENSDQNGWYVLDTKNRKIIANDVSRERAIAIAKSGGYSVWQTENGTFINSAKTVRYPGLGWIDVSETMNEQGVAKDKKGN